MKRVWLLVFGVFLLSLLGGGGATLALFAAQTNAQEGEITSGVVSLNGYRAEGDIVDGPMFYITAEGGANQGGLNGKKPTGLWAPGDSVTRSFQVENSGTLAAQLKRLSATVTGDEHLAQMLQVQVCADRDCDGDVYYEGTLSALGQNPQPFAPPLVLQPGLFPGEGDLVTLFFKVTLPVTAGNDVQNGSVTAAFQVYAEQVRNNP
jgi:predicted ribosomally synthesized peptide with SipW-like signal peptide